MLAMLPAPLPLPELVLLLVLLLLVLLPPVVFVALEAAEAALKRVKARTVYCIMNSGGALER